MATRSANSLPPLLSAAQLPFGAPPGRYGIIDLPRNVKAARFVTIELADKARKLNLFLDGASAPSRQPRVRGLQARYTRLRIDYGADVNVTRAYLNHDTSFVFVVGRLASPLVLRDDILLPCEVTLTTYYITGRGEKVLHECYLLSQHPPADIGWALTRFDEYYAVDTNTVDAAGIGRLSVTAVLKGRAARLEDGFSVSDYELVHREAAIDVVGNPELHALYNIARRLEAAYPEGSRKLIGLITDTEHSILREINFRRQPLYLDYYLPPNLELIYATSDTGATEYMPNKMMRECDTAASQALSHAIKSHASRGAT